MTYAHLFHLDFVSYCISILVNRGNTILRPRRGIRRDLFSKLEQNDGSCEFQWIRTFAE